MFVHLVACPLGYALQVLSRSGSRRTSLIRSPDACYVTAKRHACLKQKFKTRLTSLTTIASIRLITRNIAL